jgi:hypothetical protein
MDRSMIRQTISAIISIIPSASMPAGFQKQIIHDQRILQKGEITLNAVLTFGGAQHTRTI